MVYKIADFYIEATTAKGNEFTECREYLCTDYPRIDTSIVIKKEDTLREVALAEELGESYINHKNCRSLALYRKICAFALANDAFLMHCAVIEYEGRGFAFLAQSGTGKTTHIRQWKKAFGDEKVVIVNGDKPIIRFIDGKVYAYGTPWNGKEGYGTTGRTELHGICFVTRGEENSIMKISSETAVPLLFSQIMIRDSTDLARQLELADKLVEKVPMYLLKCNISEDAARVAYAGMQE